jgi:hypothetical protein
MYFEKKAPTGLARLQQPLPVRKKNVSSEINLKKITNKKMDVIKKYYHFFRM